jgi:cytochrome c551/c552
MSIIDVTNDPAFSNLRVLSEQYPGLVEFAKAAELSPEEFEALPAGAFAWPEKRVFPIHTKEHAAISQAYAKHAGELPAHVQESLKLACDAHSIPEDLLVPSNTKTAGAVYHLLPELNRFRVASAEDVLYAVDALEKQAHVLTDEQRTEACHNLAKVAETFGVTVNPILQKYAGNTLTDTEVLADWLDARAEASEWVGNKIAAVEFKSLGQSYRHVNKYLGSKEDQVKLAQAIAELDKLAGIEKYVGKSLPNPILTVWNTTKVAAQQLELNGMLFDKNKLASLPASFWNDALGPDFVEEFAPGGVVDPAMLETVLQTLPADMKASLATQLAPYAA